MVWVNSEAPCPAVNLYPHNVAITWVGIKPPEAGLTNMGNSCFVNSAIQALFHLPGFVQFLDNDDGHRKQCYSLLNCVLCALSRTLLNMRLHRVFKPTGLINLLPKIHKSFKIGMQEDADEFVVALLSHLEDSLVARSNIPKLDFCSQKTTAVGKLFSFWMKNNYTCVDCGRGSSTFDSFRSVPIAVEAGNVQSGLNSFFAQEEIIDEYKCRKECKASSCRKDVSLFSYPKVIRTVFNRFNNAGDKVALPIEVNKTVEVVNATYHLSSCVLHKGTSSKVGHYTCLAVRSDGRLMHYDDSEVNDGSHLLTASDTECNVYFAFYQFHHFKPQSLKRSPPCTPSKALSPLRKKIYVSPLKKSLEKKSKKKGLFSPRKFKRKVGDFFKTIIPSKSMKISDTNAVETLAEPLATEHGEDMEKDPAPHVMVQRRRSLVTAGDGSGGAGVTHQVEATPDALITPIKISWRPRMEPKSSESQSNNEYIVHQGEDSVSSAATPDAPITPFKISWRRKTVPKSSESQSSNEYIIHQGEHSEQPHLSDGTQIETPHLTCIPEETNALPNITDIGVENDQVPFLSGDGDVCQLGDDIDHSKADFTGDELPHPVIAENKVVHLQKWLQLRKIPYKGNKAKLITRVQNCINLGLDKVGGQVLTQDVLRLNGDDIFPKHGWEIFPSADIPNNFNFGSVFYYLIETMPDLESHHQTSSCADSSDDNFSEDEEVEEQVVISDPFEHADNNEIRRSKKLRRGLQFVKSGFVGDVMDLLNDRFHVYKGRVRASMNKIAYTVHIGMSQISGNIVKCTCECPQKTLGRCSHVGALLLSILLHKHLNGPAAITCTSRPCTWNQGSLKHNPSIANMRQYESFKINVIRRATFDPRADEFRDYPRKVDKLLFKCALTHKAIPCMFQNLLPIEYQDFTYSDCEKEILRDNRQQLYAALWEQMEMLKPSLHHSGPFEVKETLTQSKSDNWMKIRSLHCSAEPSKKIAQFKKESAKMNFLRDHLWRMKKIETKAMAFGKKHEHDARKKYAKEQAIINPSCVVEECGLYLNTDYVGLSCSPDGIKRIPQSNADTLLEIKCIYSMRDKDPNKFETILTKKQLRSFCLARDKSGDIMLKKTHKYYDQVQFSMGLMNLKSCDLVIWTNVSSLTVTVPFDKLRWIELEVKLSNFHWEYLMPEYFAQRTPRLLEPIALL